MQVLKLPAIAGLIWVSAGFRLLYQQMLRMFSVVVIYFFVVLFINFLALWVGDQFPEHSEARELVPRVLTFMFAIFSPVLQIGYMEACRDIARGERISPLYFLRGFQLPRPAFLSLLAIGLFQVSALTLVLTVLPLPQNLEATLTAAANQPAPVIDPQALLVQCAALAVVLVIMSVAWYAPMLAAWHGMRVGKAMFFSMAACWRNKTAFIMFGLGWTIAGFFSVVLMSLAIAALGNGALANALVAIMLMLLIGAMYCSVYVTYSTVFVPDTTPPAP